MCAARDKEDSTVSVLIDAIKKNGKCSSHEDISNGLAAITARFNLMFLFQCAIALLLVIHLGWK